MDNQTLTVAAELIHATAKRDGGSKFIALEFDDSEGIVLALDIDNQERLAYVLDGLHALLGGDVPNYNTHVQERKLGRHALGSLGSNGRA